MAGLTAASLAPSPFVSVAVLGTGVYLVIAAVRTLRASRRRRKEQS